MQTNVVKDPNCQNVTAECRTNFTWRKQVKLKAVNCARHIIRHSKYVSHRPLGPDIKNQYFNVRVPWVGHGRQWRRQRSTIARSFQGQINVEPGQSLIPAAKWPHHCHKAVLSKWRNFATLFWKICVWLDFCPTLEFLCGVWGAAPAASRFVMHSSQIWIFWERFQSVMTDEEWESWWLVNLHISKPLYVAGKKKSNLILKQKACLLISMPRFQRCNKA